MDRLLARVGGLTDAEASRRATADGWSVAQVMWHVAATNDGFAGIVDGSRPLAVPPADDFVETPFADIQAQVPDRLEAPEVFQPAADVTRAEALVRLQASRERFVAAYRALTPERGTWTIKSILGLLTVYQVGDWAAAHVARHNAQAKRALGR